MAEPIYSRRAEVDILEIWTYIGQTSIPAADRVVDRVVKRCEFLAENPGIGESQPDIGRGLRTFSADSYVIFFRRRGDETQIVRVLHGSRDWMSLDWDEP